MKILFSIIINALILFVIAYFLAENKSLGIENGIELGCGDCSLDSLGAWKIYITGGIILGLINVTIRPILKILSLPFFLLLLGLVSFVINGIILYILNYIMSDVLMIDGIYYKIIGWENFMIAVVIFTILNILYSFIFNKK